MSPELVRVDDAPNAIHDSTTPDASWSSINLAEAAPGVMTQLCWALWGPAGERGIRQPFFAMGALTRAEAGIPDDPDRRALKIFFGRRAVRVDVVCALGDRIPGQSGEGLARDVFGFVPPGHVPHPTLRRLPVIATRYPRTLWGIGRRARALRAGTDAWWRAELARTPSLDLAGARAQFACAAERFGTTLGAQAEIVACVIQPLHEQVARLAARAGVDGGSLMTGHGSHEETAAIADLWRVSRATLPLEDFLARHGYHGAAEGEVSSRVWREDPEPVRRLVEGYRALGDDQDPARAEERRRAERAAAGRDLLVLLPRSRRPLARLLLDRAAAMMRARYERLDVPSSFTGQPVATERVDQDPAARRLTGVAASPGVVVGRAVVVTDPADADVAPGDILVAHTTDPAWASLMFLAEGLVVDIGGMLSHAAVVAREIGVPCVMNTGDGTRVLRTGDRVRVDGAAGTVEIIDGGTDTEG